MSYVIDRNATEATLRKMLADHRLPSGRIESPGYRAACYLAAVGIPPAHIVGIADAIGMAGFDVFLSDVHAVAAGGWQYDYPVEHVSCLAVPAASHDDFRAAIQALLDPADERQAPWLNAAMAAVPAS